MDREKEKILDVTKEQIEKKFGKGSLMKLGESAATDQVAAIPTGSLALDAALGIGGVPRGRIVEIYGPESSGKTTLALQIIAEAQAAGGVAAFIDAEHALDPSYASRLGVDIDEILISQPDTGEQALEICDMLVRSGAIDVVVIDSVAALVPRAELEGEMGDTTVGLQARLMSQALRKLAGSLSHPLFQFLVEYADFLLRSLALGDVGPNVKGKGDNHSQNNQRKAYRADLGPANCFIDAFFYA